MGARVDGTTVDGTDGAEDAMQLETAKPTACTCLDCLVGVWQRDRSEAIALATRRLEERGLGPVTLRKSA